LPRIGSVSRTPLPSWIERTPPTGKIDLTASPRWR
jgi:hypothetical protein